MQTKIKKITKKSWFYFFGAGGIAIAFFAKMFLGGSGIIDLPKLESDAKDAIIQTGVVGIANADTPGGDGDSAGDGGDSAGDGGDCDSSGDCGDSGGY